VAAPKPKLAACVMVLGTTSGAGKSWLATALCRWYAQQGYKVAPFKAQNMSNNARVVAGQGGTPEIGGTAQAEGTYGEIGSAQYFQALAARAAPHVRMNPVLLKPEADTHSQVVLLGQVSPALTAMPWRTRSEHVWPHITQALDALRADNDVVVIEGAGSPAEINLHSSDIVNMRVARHAQAPCLLVTDIDRGGAFAHLYGTWALLPPDEQALIKGFVLNMFRGDPALLAPAPQMLLERTGIPVVATLPMWRAHGLPEEDGMFDEHTASSVGNAGTAGGAVHTTIAVLAYPRISNLDEYQALKNIRGVRLVWARSPADVHSADCIILPGSKHTSSDLAWLRSQGLDAAVAQHAAAGKRVLGVCGGLQMLGEALIDPHGIDGNAPGLGLLPLVTVFEAHKTVAPIRTQLASLPGAWAQLSGAWLQGYEIHHGRTQVRSDMLTQASTPIAALPHNLGWCNAQGNVLGVYVHGLFENTSVVQALFGAQAQSLDQVFDGLAAYIAPRFEPGFLSSLLD
jgi:adenosylcobyric acid synthase